MNVLLIISVIIICESVFSQNRNKEVSYEEFEEIMVNYEKGIEAYNNQQFVDAIRFFKVGIKSIETRPNSLLYLSELYMKLDSPSVSLEYASLAFKEGVTMENISITLFNKHIDTLERMYDKNKHEYLSRIDSKLAQTLDSLEAKDQQYRSNPELFRKSDSIRLLQYEIDSLNSAFLKNIIREKGWPGRSLLGRDYMPVADIIAIHSSYEDKIFFINKAAEAAFCDRNGWAEVELMIYAFFFKHNRRPYLEIPLLKYDESGNVVSGNLNLPIKRMAEFMENFHLGVEAFSSNSSEDVKSNNLYIIKEELLANGIADEDIKIETDVDMLENERLPKESVVVRFFTR